MGCKFWIYHWINLGIDQGLSYLKCYSTGKSVFVYKERVNANHDRTANVHRSIHICIYVCMYVWKWFMLKLKLMGHMIHVLCIFIVYAVHACLCVCVLVILFVVVVVVLIDSIFMLYSALRFEIAIAISIVCYQFICSFRFDSVLNRSVPLISISIASQNVKMLRELKKTRVAFI